MGLFKKRATDPAEIERLQAEISAMAVRLNANEAAKTELDDTVRGLTTRLDTSTPPPPTPPPPAPSGPGTSEIDRLNARIERLASRVDDAPLPDTARIDQLSEQVEQLATSQVDERPGAAFDPAKIDQLNAQMRRIDERIDEIDQRITSISTELANQINELSGDIDGAGERATTVEVVDELRDAQTRLASEQARYQIAFRQDLAELVDRLRRA